MSSLFRTVLRPFSRKKFKRDMELEILMAQLDLLSSDLTEGRDKPTDLSFWQEKIKALQEAEIDELFLRHKRTTYLLMYGAYLHKHYPELEKELGITVDM